MTKIETLNKRRKELGLTYEDLSVKTGIPVSTIQKIFGGYTKSPRYNNLVALEQALIYAPRGELAPGLHDERFEQMEIEEEALVYYENRGPYTVADLKAREDGEHYELIEGFYCVRGCPSIRHQVIISSLLATFMTYIRAHEGPCLVLPPDTGLAPEDDEKTYLKPDLAVVCDYEKMNAEELIRGPELTVEVVSPTSRQRDFYTKARLYENFGVREYWIVDPKKEKVTVYQYGENESDIDLYTFDEMIPVGIFGGDLTIDFAPIKAALAALPQA